MSKDDIVDYKFKCINPTEYELLLIYHAKGSLINTIFSKSKEKLLRKENININGNPDDINNFVIPPNYLKLLKTIVSSNLKGIEGRIKKNGIHILSSNILSAYFKRNSESGWNIHINFKGMYADKR